MRIFYSELLNVSDYFELISGQNKCNNLNVLMFQKFRSHRKRQHQNDKKKSQKIQNNIKILINSKIRPSREANRRPIHQAATKIFMYWNNGRGFRLVIDTSTKYYVNNTPLLGIQEFRSNASFIMIFAPPRFRLQNTKRNRYR